MAQTFKSLMTETIDGERDVGVVQNQSLYPKYMSRHGVYVFEWSVAAELSRQGLSGTLPNGTYNLPFPAPSDTADTLSDVNQHIRAGDIIQEVVTQTQVAKAGAGTITPDIGGDAMSAIASTGVNDDTAQLAATPKEITTDAAINVVVAGGGVTAGSFTMFLRVYQGRV